MSRTSRLTYVKCAAIAAAAAGILAAFTPQVVVAQMMDSYRFQARDRASIAFGMREVENRQNPPQAISGGGGGGGSLTQLVCPPAGGGGSTAAGSMANSSCVILNDVTGSVDVGQDSTGDQNANANSESSVSDTIEELAGE
jgi:hypothetical protein